MIFNDFQPYSKYGLCRYSRTRVPVVQLCVHTLYYPGVVLDHLLALRGLTARRGAVQAAGFALARGAAAGHSRDLLREGGGGEPGHGQGGGRGHFGETPRHARRFYRVPDLKTPPYGKCSQNRKMVWHFYGKTKTAITSSKNQFRPQF